MVKDNIETVKYVEKKRKSISLGRWLLVLICFGAIAYFSNQPAVKQKDMGSFINEHPRIIRCLRMLPAIQFYYHGSLEDSEADPARFWGYFVLRKGVHFFLYGLSGLVLVWALRGSGLKWSAWFLAGIVIAAAAGLDEYNQLMSNGARTGCREDAILDTCGYLFFSMVAIICYQGKEQSSD